MAAEVITFDMIETALVAHGRPEAEAKAICDVLARSHAKAHPENNSIVLGAKDITDWFEGKILLSPHQRVILIRMLANDLNRDCEGT